MEKLSKNGVLLLTLALLFQITACAAKAATPVFSDVSADADYDEAVTWCYENGLMNGVEDGSSFDPEGSMTRAMLATILHRQAGEPEVENAPGFTDVLPGVWYSDAVAWAAEKQLFRGYGNGLFGVDDLVSKEMLQVVIARQNGEDPSWTGAAELAVPAKRYEAAVALYETFAPAQPASTQHPSTGCSRPSGGSSSGGSDGGPMSLTPTPAPTPTPVSTENRVLVAYFSATNTTRTLAEYAADILTADLYEIIPEVPYTSADLAYYTGGRADQEQNDSNARPAINGSVDNMDAYDIVFVGYPIWHGQPPRVISTFLESYDFSGKTIVPFCTSHSSGYSDSSIKPLAPNAEWITGRRFSSGTSHAVIENWLGGLDLPEPEEERTVGVFDFESKTVMLNSGYTMPINGLGTYSLHGETCVNAVKSALASGVRLIDTAHMYGNEEEIGQAIRESIADGIVRREDLFVITKIYPGSDMANPEAAIQGCLDRLDIGYVDMMLLHHPDTNDVKAYKAMEKFVADGKIRSLGLSNWYVSELTSFLPQVTITPALVQNEIHPYYQENDVVPFIQDKGIVVQCWYPLGGRGHTSELLNNSTITAIAQTHGVSSAQVILRWDLQRGIVVIPGSSNPDHIKENTDLYHFELTEEEMEQIKALDRNEKHDWY